MKIRDLKALLQRRGYIMRPGRGSHTIWQHPDHPDTRPIVICGADGADAHDYVVARVCQRTGYHRPGCARSTTMHSHQRRRSNHSSTAH